MNPKLRRIVQAILYEVFAVAFVGPVLSVVFDKPTTSTLGLALVLSSIALVWSYLFNTMFERWEARQAKQGRTLLRRLSHGIGFEGGLVVILVPVMAFWLDTSALSAFMANLGLLAFFFVYAVAFTWVFDRVFGLPESAVGESAMAIDREFSADLRRVVIIGTSGSGKSTSGERLAKALGSAFIELDELYWAPNWQPKPTADFLALVRQAAAAERWVAAGNYSGARNELWPRASAVVWLNFGLPLVLRRLIRRTASRVLSREALWHGNRESFVRTLFTKESVVWYAVKTHHRRKREFAALRASDRFPHLHWYEFTQPSQFEHYLSARAIGSIDV